MSAKACASGLAVLDVWKIFDGSNRQLFAVKRASGSDPNVIGVSIWMSVQQCWLQAGGYARCQQPLIFCVCLVLLAAAQVNTTIVDVGRTAEGCAAHLSVGSASVGQCAVTTTGLGSSAAPGAQRWVLEAVPGEAGMVYISNQVGSGGVSG